MSFVKKKTKGFTWQVGTSHMYFNGESIISSRLFHAPKVNDTIEIQFHQKKKRTNTKSTILITVHRSTHNKTDKSQVVNM